ncbi:MAG: DUF4249 family protein [Bacteroidales bacterium]|nr:DUF4249 family protein [Bacteroidales bacterium]
MKRVLIIFISLLLLSSSCRKIVQDEFKCFENTLTANSILIEGEYVQLHLSLTDELNEYQLINVSNANIEMYNQDSLFLSFAYVENGIYVSDYIIRENDSFTLKVNKDNDSVSSECLIPAKPELLDFYVNENAWVDNEGILQPQLNFTILNNKSKECYFEAYILIYNTTADYVIEEYPVLYFDNSGFNADSISKCLKIQHHSYSYPPEKHQYQLIIKAVDFNYYKYVTSITDYNLGRYPDFSNATIVPTNLFSNIKNGYGIFCGYSQTISDIIGIID